MFPLVLIHLGEQQHNQSVTHGPPPSQRHANSSTNYRTSTSKLTTIAQSSQNLSGSVLLCNREFTDRPCLVESSDHNLASAHFAWIFGSAAMIVLNPSPDCSAALAASWAACL
jgi:hypothetical protein